MTPLAYLRIWLASARYSAVRAMMFRFDFFLWLAVDTAWMVVNLVFIEVLFDHIDELATWTKPEMILLYGVSMLLTRLFFAFFFTNLVSVDRHLREGTLDFTLAQPGNPLFMLATRKVEFDSLLNAALAIGVIAYAVHTIPLELNVAKLVTFTVLIACGLVVHFSIMVILVALAFWLDRAQGVEGGYFGLFEVSRLPRQAMQGAMEVTFVYALPAIVVSNVPAMTLKAGPDFKMIAWLFGLAILWLALATTFFHRGLRRYRSASS
jgi:ABC-2 type transport system permease protein